MPKNKTKNLFRSLLLLISCVSVSWTPAFAEGCGSALDVVFVVDKTGSMQPVLDSLKNDIGAYADTIETLSGGDYRLGLVTFADHPNVRTDLAMSTNNKGAFLSQVTAIQTSQGGFLPESSTEGVELAGDMTFRGEAAKFIILITDAPPGGTDDIYGNADVHHLQTLAAELKTKDIHVLGIQTEPPLSTNPIIRGPQEAARLQAETALRLWANLTEGLYASSLGAQASEVIGQSIGTVCGRMTPISSGLSSAVTQSACGYAAQVMLGESNGILTTESNRVLGAPDQVGLTIRNTTGNNHCERSSQNCQPPGGWVSTDGGNCTQVCASQGKHNVPSNTVFPDPPGYLCASGEARPFSAGGRVNYIHGCAGTSCAGGNRIGDASARQGFNVGEYCYGHGQKQDNDDSDRTVGCFCGGGASPVGPGVLIIELENAIKTGPGNDLAIYLEQFSTAQNAASFEALVSPDLSNWVSLGSRSPVGSASGGRRTEEFEIPLVGARYVKIKLTGSDPYKTLTVDAVEPLACPICGNSIEEDGEECDLGDQNGVDGSACSNQCKELSMCGYAKSVIDPGTNQHISGALHEKPWGNSEDLLGPPDGKYARFNAIKRLGEISIGSIIMELDNPLLVSGDGMSEIMVHHAFDKDLPTVASTMKVFVSEQSERVPQSGVWRPLVWKSAESEQTNPGKNAYQMFMGGSDSRYLKLEVRHPENARIFKDGEGIDAIEIKSCIPCGDGSEQGGEQCDDGNKIDGDGCSSSCKEEIAECGNGIIEAWGDEACDEGSQNGNIASGCSLECNQLVACSVGDITLDYQVNGLQEYQPGQQIRYGFTINNQTGKGLQNYKVEIPIDPQLEHDPSYQSAGFSYKVEGNRLIITPEESYAQISQYLTVKHFGFAFKVKSNASGGAVSNTPAIFSVQEECVATVSKALAEPITVYVPRCGDGRKNPFEPYNEYCDDGNQDNTDDCTNECQFADCGDGFVQPGKGEECDEGGVCQFVPSLERIYGDSVPCTKNSDCHRNDPATGTVRAGMCVGKNTSTCTNQCKNVLEVALLSLQANDDIVEYTKDEWSSQEQIKKPGSVLLGNDVPAAQIGLGAGKFVMPTWGGIGDSGKSREGAQVFWHNEGDNVVFYYGFSQNAALLSRVRGLGPGEVFEDSFTYKIHQVVGRGEALAGGVSENSDTATVRIIIRNTETPPADDPAEARIRQTARPTTSGAVVAKNRNLTYIVQIKNTGGSPMTNVQLRYKDFDSRLEFSGVTTGALGGPEGNDLVIRNIGNPLPSGLKGIAPGQKVTIQVRTRVKADAAPGRIQSIYEVTADGLEQAVNSNPVVHAVVANENFACGNGRREMDEECDDKNRNPNDGCSPSCRIEFNVREDF